MKYALLIFAAPSKTGQEEIRAWQNVIGTDHSKRPGTAGVERLSESAYLFDLSNGLHSLMTIAAHAEEFGIGNRTLFFDQYPSFVVSKGKHA